MGPPEDASICIGCGMCCDGTLHGTATVLPGDEASVAAAGLVIVNDGKRRFFRQPCLHYGHGKCSIYSDRPKVCQSYRCALLESVEAGEVSRSEAQDKISTAKNLLQAVRSVAPAASTPGERAVLAERLRAELDRVQGIARERTMKALLDIGMLEHFLNRWFLKQKMAKAPNETATEDSR